MVIKSNDSNDLEVEMIVSCRSVRGTVEYFVKFKKQPNSSNRWLSESEVCPEAIRKYNEENETRRGVPEYLFRNEDEVSEIIAQNDITGVPHVLVRFIYGHSLMVPMSYAETAYSRKLMEFYAAHHYI